MEDSVDENQELAGVGVESPRPALAHRIYVGRRACGCAVAATIDANDLAEMARNGYSIETVDAEVVQIAGCNCATPRETRKGSQRTRAGRGEPSRLS